MADAEEDAVAQTEAEPIVDAGEPAPVAGAAVADAEADNDADAGERVDILRILSWIGFTADQCGRLIDELGTDLRDIGNLNHKDITELAESFQRRTVAMGKFLFGLLRTRRLKALTHWVKDFARQN